ncbi:MAG TPA: hypothetical protein VNT42_12230, partial [Sphingomonas sp.]|nr:hypothetical protein [Sphingomonas sp.]
MTLTSQGWLLRTSRWRRRVALLFRSRRLLVLGEFLAIAALLSMAAITYSVLNNGGPDGPLNPFLVALL